MAPIVQNLSLQNKIDYRVCVTGQHKEMLTPFLKIFNIKPDYDLKVMRKQQSLNHTVANIVQKIDSVLKNYKPDVVLVHGDTNSALATALASFYSKIKIGHVEAGLRTYNMESPFPEEANRVLIDRIADYYFAPTKENQKNLIKEGVLKNKILISGNTAIDSLVHMSQKLEGPTAELKNSGIGKILESGKKIILITGHRRENIGKGFEQICDAILGVSTVFPDIEIIYPLHLNPAVREPVIKKIQGRKNVHIINPLSYDSFVYLMKKSYLILTDSGGIQEEAISLNKPVLVMRNTTERKEAISIGSARLVGANKNNIVKYTKLLLKDANEYRKMTGKKNPYGDGKAGNRIIKFLSSIK